MRCKNGHIGVYGNKPYVGVGDHWFFPVSEDTYFVHDDRFEILRHPYRWKYCGILYFHLRYLKNDFGFSNYELAKNPDSPYATDLEQFLKDASCQKLSEFIAKRAWMCDLYPWRNPKALIISRIPIPLLKILKNTNFVQSNLALIRAIRIADDLKNIKLPIL
jgi:hypothetical protein